MLLVVADHTVAELHALTAARRAPRTTACARRSTRSRRAVAPVVRRVLPRDAAPALEPRVRELHAGRAGCGASVERASIVSDCRSPIHPTARTRAPRRRRPRRTAGPPDPRAARRMRHPSRAAARSRSRRRHGRRARRPTAGTARALRQAQQLGAARVRAHEASPGTCAARAARRRRLVRQRVGAQRPLDAQRIALRIAQREPPLTSAPGATSPPPSSTSESIAGQRFALGRPLHSAVIASTAASFVPSGSSMPYHVAVASCFAPT